jgi:5,10-methylenetetrahydromethanopterin reductase
MALSATLFPARVGDTGAQAAWLESLGYRGLWVSEGRMRRDAVTAMTLASAATSQAYVASGIIPCQTRHVTTLAITWKSLYQLAPGRVRLGLGAWWEPIASRAGLRRRSPMQVLREVVAVLRELFEGNTVSLDGEYVRVTDMVFDGVEDENGAAYPVPIYLAAVGERMLRLAGELADGVLLDFLVPPSYTASALDRLAEGRERRELPTGCDRPQLVACACDDGEPGQAMDEMRVVVARYLAQPHIARYSGADPELVAALQERLTWPATGAELRHAAALVPRDFVRSIAAVGTSTQVLDRIEEYLAAGATEVVVAPFGARREETFELVARKAGRAMAFAR